jgi:hypothetical protein
MTTDFHITLFPKDLNYKFSFTAGTCEAKLIPFAVALSTVSSNNFQ